MVSALARHFAQYNNVKVACAPGGFLVEDLKNSGVNVREVEGLKRSIDPTKLIKSYREISRIIKDGKFDLVHTHSTKAGVLGRLAAQGKSKAVLFTAHGWAFTEGKKAWKRWPLARLESFMSDYCDKIICVSQFDKRLALEFGVGSEEKFDVIKNGINPSNFLSASPAEEISTFKGNENVIATFIGRFMKQKDPLNHLRAIRRTESVKLMMVGDGPLLGSARRYVDENNLNGVVTLLGLRHDVPKILAGSDMFVLNSRWEGLPLTIIEAMLAGLPVIASRVGGVSELVEDGQTGFLVKPESPEVTAEKMGYLAKNPKRRREMGKAGREKALREFTEERMLDETENLYREVLAG